MARRARAPKKKKEPVAEEWERHPESEKLVAELITKHHPHLTRARIICVSKPKAGTKGESRIAATVRKPSKLLQALYKDATGQDLHYTIEIGKDLWLTSSKDDRIVLIDHELTHCTGLDDKGRWGLRPDHDVEEFVTIVTRYGEKAGAVRQRVMRQMSLVEK